MDKKKIDKAFDDAVERWNKLPAHSLTTEETQKYKRWLDAFHKLSPEERIEEAGAWLIAATNLFNEVSDRCEQIKFPED